MSTHRSILSVLRHPLWIASLGLLVLNDHVLKGSGLLPGWLTGKLSDVAGMLVAPALLALVLALVLRVRREHSILVAHLAVGVGFAMLELSRALSAQLDALYQTFGLRWVSTADWTDLLALALLPLSYAFVLRTSAAALPAPVPSRPRRRPIELALAVAGLAASVATSAEEPPPPCDPDEDFDCDMDGFGVPEDCNDFDSSISPSLGNCPGSDGEEWCDNGVDDNEDGAIDCLDPQCSLVCADAQTVCSVPPALVTDEQGMLHGTTLIGSWALEGSCGGSDAPEAVFLFNSIAAGTLVIDVPEGHVAYARSQCLQTHSELGCVSSEAGEPDGDDEGVPAQLILDLSAYQQIAVVIDAIDGLAASEFVTPVLFLPLGCGDQTTDVSIGEECDDGNLESGDGCSAWCRSEAAPVCDLALDLPLGETSVSSFDGASRFFTSMCSEGAGGELAPERAFVFTNGAQPGVLTVTASAAGSPLSIFAESECGGASIACAPYAEAGELTDLALPLAAGATVYVFVEGVPGTPAETVFEVSGQFVAN